MDDLRHSYLEGLAGRIESLEAARDALSTTAKNDALATIRRHAHSLRGTGATYGFPEVTTAAKRLEESSEAQVHALLDALLDVLRTARSGATSEDGTHRILLVQADAELARALCDHLEGDNREVVVVDTAAKAELKAHHGPWALVVLDVVLPDADGRVLLSRLKRSASMAIVPVLVLTALKDEAARTECYALGADDVLVKPVSAETLAASVSSKLAQQMRIVRITHRDDLTGLLNRNAFGEVFAQNIALCRRQDSPCTVAILDLDGLRSINTTYGYAEGDAALRAIADRFAGQLRAGDVLARWADEKFVALMPGTDEERARTGLQRVLDDLAREPVRLKNSARARITFSAGVAEVGPSVGADEAVARADWFLFSAKSDGPGRIVCAKDKIDERRTTVLLAEDDPEMAKLITTYLEEAGFGVARASDGDGAFRTLHEQDVSLAILDIKMPGMDGFELLGRIRKASRLETLPVMMVTSVGDERSIVEAFQRGADDYVVKPFAIEELMARVRRLVTRAR